LHSTRISIRYAATAATGLRSVEVEVLEALSDWEIHAALLSLPKECRMAVCCADVDDVSYAQSAARWCAAA
jgi:DNA-directed RNA polymerase specialized sigma24 family protein